MSPFLLLVAAAATGIEVGWQPLPEGGYEYTIQIEPELAEGFVRGDHEIVSSVPANIDARRYRIVVGRGKLARVEGGAPPAVAAPSRPVAERAPPAAALRSRPPVEPIAEVPEPPLETLAQPQQADPPPLAADDSLKDLPEPPDDTGPAMAVPLEPKALPQNQPDPNPFDRRQPPETEKHAAENAHLPAAETAPMLLKSGYEEATKVNRPPTEGGSTSEATSTEPPRPWTAFVLALVLLCCSLGANAYLGWIAWDARARYRSALSKLGMSGAA